MLAQGSSHVDHCLWFGHGCPWHIHQGESGISLVSPPISYALPKGHFHRVSQPEFVVRRVTWAAPRMTLFTSNTLQPSPVTCRATSQVPQHLAHWVA